MKRLLRESTSAAERVRGLERQLFVDTWSGADHTEAVEAYFERRPAKWGDRVAPRAPTAPARCSGRRSSLTRRGARDGAAPRAARSSWRSPPASLCVSFSSRQATKRGVALRRRRRGARAASSSDPDLAGATERDVRATERLVDARDLRLRPTLARDPELVANAQRRRAHLRERGVDLRARRRDAHLDGGVFSVAQAETRRTKPIARTAAANGDLSRPSLLRAVRLSRSVRGGAGRSRPARAHLVDGGHEALELLVRRVEVRAHADPALRAVVVEELPLRQHLRDRVGAGEIEADRAAALRVVARRVDGEAARVDELAEELRLAERLRADAVDAEPRDGLPPGARRVRPRGRPSCRRSFARRPRRTASAPCRTRTARRARTTPSTWARGARADRGARRGTPRRGRRRPTSPSRRRPCRSSTP